MKKHEDNEVVELPKLMKDEKGEIILICSEEKREETEAIFNDNPKINKKNREGK
jgi:hypothetical protein